MDISLIKQFDSGARIYQGAAPDEWITHFQSPGRNVMLVEMAAGVNALEWVRQGTIRSVLYFGIDDSPESCLDDDVLCALARSCRAWLDDPKGDVIFGCAAGVSRSSYADCATLMAKLKVPFDEAIAIVRAGRPIANPNSGFTAHLRRLEDRLKNL